MQVGRSTRLLVGYGCLVWLVPDGILVFARTELALTQMISECCVEFVKIGLEVALDNKNFLVQLCGRHWEISCYQRRISPVVLQHSKSVEMLLTSVDTAVKVRSTVNTKRTVYSVAGLHSSTNLSLPILGAYEFVPCLCCIICTLAIPLLDTHQNTVK